MSFYFLSDYLYPRDRSMSRPFQSAANRAAVRFSTSAFVLPPQNTGFEPVYYTGGKMAIANRKQAGHRNIVFDIPMQLVGVPPSPGPDALRPVEHAFGVAFPLPSVAHSCTSAQEVVGAFRADQGCAGDGADSPREISRVMGSITMISRPI